MPPEITTHPHEAAAQALEARPRQGNPAAQLALVLFFLVAIGSVGLWQTIAELKQGQGVRALEVLRRKPTAKNLREFENNLLDSSILAGALRPLVLTGQFKWLKDGGEKTLVGRNGWLFYKPGFDERLRTQAHQKAGNTAQEAVTAIAAYRDALAERGIRLIMMPAPDKESIYPELTTSRHAGVPGPSPAMKALLSGLRSKDIEVMDLFQLFASARKLSEQTNGPLYLPTDTHWSPYGVSCAVTATAEYLFAKGLLEPGTVRFVETPMAVSRLGDLVRMLRLPMLERDHSRELVNCVQVKPISNGTESENRESPVLVLGDSFLRIYEQDAPGSAGYVSNLSRALGTPVASIINDGGASTLVRQELFRRPALLRNKRVVLWEFVERDLRLGTEGWQIVPLPPQL